MALDIFLIFASLKFGAGRCVIGFFLTTSNIPPNFFISMSSAVYILFPAQMCSGSADSLGFHGLVES